jgi:hypothetical protein
MRALLLIVALMLAGCPQQPPAKEPCSCGGKK